MAHLAHLDIPLTIGFFLIITGIITWAALAIIGVWHVLGLVEGVMNAIDAAANRRRMLKIYRR